MSEAFCRLLRAHAWAATVLAVLALAYLPWSVSSHFGNMDGDSAIYYMSARHFAPYVAPDPVAARAAGQSQFPPLYPALLAATGAAVDLRWAHVVTTLCLLAALLASYAWLLALGIARGSAAACIAVLGLLPGTWLLALSLQSEPLYLALSMTALALLARAEAANPRMLLSASVAVSAAILCRTAGVALVPALVLGIWRLRPRLSQAFAMVLLAAGPALAWMIYHRSEYSYLDDVSLGLPSEPGRWLLASLGNLASGLGNNLFQGALAPAASTVLGLPVLFFVAARFRHFAPDLVYLLAYVAVVAVWPYPTHATRFTWVATPIVLGYLFLFAQRLQARSPMVPAALTVALLLAMAPALAAGVARWSAPAVRQVPALRHLAAWYGRDAGAAQQEALLELQLMSGMRELGAFVPAGECLLSIGWPTVSFFTGHLTYEIPDASADDATLRGEINRRPCRYFLLIGLRNPIVHRAFYPADRLDESLRPVASYRGEIAGREGELLRLVQRTAPAHGADRQ